MASTPVKELDPLENARKIKAIVMPGTTPPTTAVAWYGIAPVRIWYNPQRIIAVIDATNKYTGTIKNDADSLIPRRFIVVKSTMITSEMATWWPYNAGIAEMIASAPADVDTATVSM